jgi:hypothetical protein
MEEILLQHLGLTKEEFDKGLNDFFISKQSKNNTSKDGTFILDTMLNNGIPKGGINTFTGTSNYGSIYHEDENYIPKVFMPSRLKEMVDMEIVLKNAINTDINNNEFYGEEIAASHHYFLHLISNYKIENRNKKLNDLGI